MPEGIYCQMTIGRALDPNGNVHIEGKGIVPTVKVPVTADTLQKQANGEDVVLEAAEKAIGG
jgi:C-terminal processing protease CtpA/Prc